MVFSLSGRLTDCMTGEPAVAAAAQGGALGDGGWVGQVTGGAGGFVFANPSGAPVEVQLAVRSDVDQVASNASGAPVEVQPNQFALWTTFVFPEGAPAGAGADCAADTRIDDC